MNFTDAPSVMSNLDINSFIRDIPGFAIIKDLNSNYLSANSNTVTEFGLKDVDHLFGYSDLTIPHPLSKNGQFYRNLDMEVIQTGDSMNGICTFPFQGSVKLYRFRKSILKDIKGKNVATYSHAEECNDAILLQFIQDLIKDHPFKYNQTYTPNCFVLNKEYRDLNLSPLESSCLFYLIRKKTKSEMAEILNLPLSSIIQSVENIKHQLNVKRCREIFDLSLLNGYVNVVPPSVFSQIDARQKSFHGSNHLTGAHSNTTLLSVDKGMTNSVKLTNREYDCAKLLLSGLRIKEIAARIHLSPRTVETHIINLKDKFECRNKIELIIKLKDLI